MTHAERDGDRRLREEIRWLGEVLGHVLREQAGPEAFDLVEDVRALAKARRAGDPDAEDRLLALLADLDLTRLGHLVQALSVFFDLANLAEDRHRVRVIRGRERRGGPAGIESLEGAVAALRDGGLGPDRMQELLRKTGIEFVFTAHPTEAKRRSVREKVRDLRTHLYELDHPDLLPRERARLERTVRADLTGLWQTEFVRFRRPSVLEELDRSLFFAGNLWRVVPDLYRELQESLAAHFPGRAFDLPPLLRFGTWIGGDRDGNPFVTAEVTRQALATLRREALARHAASARATRGKLSVSSRKVGVDPALASAIDEALAGWPELGDEVAHLSETEPYRRWLRIVQWRLQRGLEDEEAPGAYRRSGELVGDLRLMRRSLAAHGGALLAEAHLDDWIRQAEVFGLSLMRMDVRQESAWYHHVVGELLAQAGLLAEGEYGELDEEGRVRVLEGPVPEPGAFRERSLGDEATEAVRLFRLLAATCRERGPDDLGALVISMTHHPSDVLAVDWLGRWAAGAESLPDGRLPVPIAPLFETIDDLERAPDVLDALFARSGYRRRLAEEGDRQIVMVGYSDSTKDGGYLSASWNLYDAQHRMQAPAEAHGLDLVFFHGRGGALGRGGGPAARHILSLPPRTLRAGLRITEQGEVLAERYDDPRIARRHLQQMLSATMAWSAPAPGPTSEAAEAAGGPGWSGTPSRGLAGDDAAALASLAHRALETYRELVELPGFIDYFEQATPIAWIEQLPIGSRPARRGGGRSLGTLRAIPWVFAWTQSRHIIPAWYGLGSALEAGESSPSALGELYRENAFFRATIDNAALALAKADMGIARIHASLVRDLEVRSAVGGRIRSEYERTRAAVLALTDQEAVLDGVPWLQRSIEVRNPYVDPLNMIQVELIRRLRATPEGTPDADRIGELLRLTVQGIAGGLRTTG
jgi:phosphoenolpyruvate carboxylase